MMFDFDLQDSSKELQARLTLTLYGKVADHPNAIACSVNDEDRLAYWDEQQWVVRLDRPIVVRFNDHVMRVLDEFESRDLPDSAVAVIEALANAGPEVALAQCDLCGVKLPVRTITVLPVCACPRCRQLLHPKPGDEPPF
jgi:hypothetical protein